MQTALLNYAANFTHWRKTAEVIYIYIYIYMYRRPMYIEG
jgi:hypothetical protein